MAQASDIRPHMEVVGADGGHVGTVDHIDGERIKLARKDSDDGRHHYLPLTAIARVDDKVHLAMPAAAARAAAATGPGVEPAGDEVLPPLRNRAVDGAPARGNFYLPWIVGIIGIILLILLVRSCTKPREAAVLPAAAPVATAALPVEAVTLPNGTSVDLAPDTLNYALQRYLASAEATPRTFTFDKLNFATGSAAIRPEDQPNVAALAQILAAYPKAVVKLVGYTDARGAPSANATLGAERAQAVAAALVAKGVDQGRISAESGGEANPAESNATPGGRFENRRSELVVLAK